MPSFDVVCRIDLQEVDNAINQVLRELSQRFDFRNVKTEIRRDGDTVHLLSADDYKVRATGTLLRERLARRQVPLKALREGPVEPGPAGAAKQQIDLQQGISSDAAREMVKVVKDAKLKVQVAIQGDQLRVTGKKKDDLQAVMKVLRDQDLGVAFQFANFRD
jgi:uncharacterized protein YajQ (UPF0234 family)